MNNPVVSVIVPCYNYGRFIDQTLESVQQQTFQNWECIVVDDGSSDNSAEVVEPFTKADPRIRYIYQENKGLPGARNTGIEAARGKYFMVLDADDLIQSQKIAAQVRCFEQYPEIDFVYSGVRYFWDGKTDQLLYSADWRNFPWALDKSGAGIDLLKYIVISSVILSHQPMIKKDAVLRIGLYKEHLRSCEDWEFYLRCMYNNLQVKYVDGPETLSLIRLHPNSMTRNRTVMINHMILVRSMVQEKLDDPVLKRLNEKFLINDLIELSIVSQQFENKKNGQKVLQQAIKDKSSFRLFLFKLLHKIFPPKFNLVILSIVRTIMKKWYYWKWSGA